MMRDNSESDGTMELVEITKTASLAILDSLLADPAKKITLTNEMVKGNHPNLKQELTIDDIVVREQEKMNDE